MSRLPPDGPSDGQVLQAVARGFPTAWRFGIVGLAGIYGAAGVMLAAIAAHMKGGPTLSVAANFFMVHAALAVALATLAGQVKRPRAWLFLATLVLFATTLFSGDLTLLTLADRRFFPAAAPIGGTLLIASWLGITLLAVVELASTK